MRNPNALNVLAIDAHLLQQVGTVRRRLASVLRHNTTKEEKVLRVYHMSINIRGKRVLRHNDTTTNVFKIVSG